MIGSLLMVLGSLLWQNSQPTRLLVVTGLAGEPQYAASFGSFGSTVVDAARKRWGLPDSSIVYLAEKPAADPTRISGTSTRDAVLEALGRFARSTGAGDVIVVLLMGHGSEQNDVARINLPGRDLTAADLALALGEFATQTLVVVNAASASGGFLKPLAGPRRTVITATKSGFERNATLFGGFFAKALAGEEADADKNGSVSVAEAYQYTRREVARAYEGDNRLQTEHAQIDDNGDGVGSAEVSASGDGAMARLIGFQLAPRTVPTDPRVASLLAERNRLETAIAGLRGRKAAMDSTTYAGELERLLLQLARVNQSIRDAGTEKPR